MAWAGVAVLCAVASLAQDAGAPPAPSQGQPAAQTQEPRSDGQIEMDVVHALDASPALKNDLITAATIQSEVTLSGTVSSQASKQLAESIASHVDGVTKVHNNLTVGNPQDAQAMQPAPDSEAQEMPGIRRPAMGRQACHRRARLLTRIRLRRIIPLKRPTPAAASAAALSAAVALSAAAASVPESTVWAISA